MDNSSTEKVLRELFDNFYKELEKAGILVLNTLKITVDFSRGEVTLSDEDETVTSEDVIYAWTPEEETPTPDAVLEKSTEARELLRRLVETLAHEGYFEQQIFQTPFAVLYTDLSSEKCRLIFKVDGGWTVMDKPLLKGWEKEMNGFLSRLLGEESPKGRNKPCVEREKS